MSNRRKRQARRGVRKAEERRAQGKTPLYDDGRRYNGYQCDPKGGCGGIYLTVDLDRGTTPMFMPCLTKQGCEGMAVSLGYPRTPPPLKLPLLVEWYSPKDSEIKYMSEKMQDHVIRGGLLRRPGPDMDKEWQKERIGPVYLRQGENGSVQLTLVQEEEE